MIDGPAPESPGGGPRPGQRASGAFAAGLGARAMRAASRLLAFFVAAALFPVESVGAFAFWLAAGTLASVLADQGLSEHVMRAVPAAGAAGSSLLRRATAIRLAATPPAALLALGAGVLLGPRLDAGGLGAFVFGLAIGSADYLGAARRAAGRFALEAVETTLVSLGALGVAAAIALLGGSFEAFEIGLGAGSAALVAVRIGTLLRRPEPGAPAVREVAGMLGAARWLWFKAMLGWAFLDATVLLLGYLSDSVQVALFASAARLVGLMTQPLIALNWVFTPALAHDAAGDPARFRAGVSRLNLLGLLFVPAGVAACAVLGRVVLAGLGAEYRQAEPVLLVLAVAFALNAGLLGGVPLVVVGAERQLVTATVLGEVVFLGGCWALAPTHGALGAALAVLAGLLAPKAMVAWLYRARALPIATAGQVALGVAIVAWLGVAAIASGSGRLAVLAAGGAVAAIAALRLLATTRILAHPR